MRERRTPPGYRMPARTASSNIAFRNRLIHGNDVLDDELVWETVKAEVPVLLSEVEGLLEERVREEDEADH